MKNLILICSLFFLVSCKPEPIPPNTTNNTLTAEMQTAFSEDWDNWDFTVQQADSTNFAINVQTAFSEDWDNWDFWATGISGDIITAFSEDWDNWSLVNTDYNIKMKTAFSEDWDNWDIDDIANGWHCDVRTSFSEDWDNWDADDSANDIHMDMVTSISNDFDDWVVTGAWLSTYPNEYKIAVLFVPIIVNVLRVQGIIP